MILGSRHYDLTLALLFVMGICTAGRYNGSWVVVSEFVHSKYKNLVALSLLVLDQVVVIVTAIYYKYVDDHWRYI